MGAAEYASGPNPMADAGLRSTWYSRARRSASSPAGGRREPFRCRDADRRVRAPSGATIVTDSSTVHPGLSQPRSDRLRPVNHGSSARRTLKALVALILCAVAVVAIACGSDKDSGAIQRDETTAARSTGTSSTHPTENPPTASASTTLKNGSFTSGTAGWAPHITLGKVVSFEVSRDGQPALRLKGTHSPGEAGVLEAVSSPVRVTPGKTYQMQSAVLMRTSPGTRGARQRVLWSGREEKSFKPVYGREAKVRRGETTQLTDTFTAPAGAVQARVTVGIVVSGVSQAAIEIGPVTFRSTS
jgi:hypothetical protein